MDGRVRYSTPANTMTPIGPYSHIAQAGDFITIGAVAGVDPATGTLAGPDIASQTIQILDSFEHMLRSVGSDLDHVLHINIFLKDMSFVEVQKQFQVIYHITTNLRRNRPLFLIVGR